MKFVQIILVAIVATAVSLGVMHFRTPADVATGKETAYERVMRTGELRCGYMNWMPSIGKNPATGAMEGIMPEIMEALAKAAELKLVWQEELSIPTYLEDMKNGRYDAECSGGWPNAIRGKYAFYTQPFAYFPLVAFVRADDTRFDKDIKALQQPGLMAAVVDGDTSQQIRRTQFPAMKDLSLPQLASVTDYFVAVEMGKADVTFSDYVGGTVYLKNNSGKLKVLPYPLRLVPQSISVPSGETQLQNLLDTALLQLLADGTIDRILDKYETNPGMFVRVKLP